MQQYQWQPTTSARLPVIALDFSKSVWWCRRRGAVRLDVERAGQTYPSPDYWGVGGTGDAEFNEPPCHDAP